MSTKIGIQANLKKFYYATPRMDMRTTSEVESSRAPNNGKPFRNKQMREIARSEASIAKTGRSKGAHVSYAPRQERTVIAPPKAHKSGAHVG